jgi:hypothetical protein
LKELKTQISNKIRKIKNELKNQKMKNQGKKHFKERNSKK